uniref:Serine hydrolase domain-containing protein n=1 Tax=Euplotes harpa TaxID=151035 RepID=A0A7S3J0R5_9SPIT|mmetsp:Transcript_12903/g.14778  ORF Transcript_12903/g.14778 Transcript_12903/m.14778 type:complete len:235 (+) Transcript_12903:119-823(+)|eukprot:CAMPEP_0168333392 /NCGR_PEP_ID=MMETSP0213-20121227/9586_1 /TAXON_ID=151035 /ORGANISM="Euplotes harpa, Strain FSP1.4" /LENGTH=234 /DNA_ID=CAMNT_0008337719 /DNA_START=226 /DNA_END=930 /DNA_ORIENTATION=+
MKHQFDYYEHIFKDYVEFVYLNGKYENNDIFDYSLYKMFKNTTFYSWAINDDKTGKPKGFLDSLLYVIDYINKTGPYDGVLGFSQGSFLVRMLLKLDEFKTEFPKLNYPPEFGIIVSGPLRLSISSFGAYPQDKYKLLTAFKQPVMYMYGEKDMYLDKIEFGLIKEGDFTIIKHKSGHNVPKLVGEEMNQFIEFIAKVYANKFDEKILFTPVIDEKFKKDYMNLQKSKGAIAKM